ncbi:MAG: small ribosomal subunit biogenesis GTPase RsgA [Chromatiales bacterium]
MAKRRLSGRQQERIARIQEERRRRLTERVEQSLATATADEPRRGRVVTRHGAHLVVADDAGALVHCLFRQNLGQVVCGDEVVWQSTGASGGVVTALLERGAVLSRPDYSGREKPLAANVTQLVVVIAPTPAPTEYLIDQYLVAAESLGVKALIAVNKLDALERDQRAGLLERFALYERMGYPVVGLSARRRQGLGPLLEHLQEETSILVGQSGVGKSSLVNALLPDLDVQVGRLSGATGLGRHTTSAATLYSLPSGGRLIDSPGVRSFRLPDLDAERIEQGFRELRPYLGRCRFKNCAHDKEPECALKDALARGQIDPRRMESFLHMVAAAADRR